MARKRDHIFSWVFHLQLYIRMCLQSAVAFKSIALCTILTAYICKLYNYSNAIISIPHSENKSLFFHFHFFYISNALEYCQSKFPNNLAALLPNFIPILRFSVDLAYNFAINCGDFIGRTTPAYATRMYCRLSPGPVGRDNSDGECRELGDDEVKKPHLMFVGIYRMFHCFAERRIESYTIYICERFTLAFPSGPHRRLDCRSRRANKFRVFTIHTFTPHCTSPVGRGFVWVTTLCEMVYFWGVW